MRAHGSVAQERLDALRRGITIDGVRYGPIEARLEREQGANVWLTFAMREGKNREVKNVLGHLGLAVNRLIRVSFGPFQLGELPEGAVEEVRTRHLREQLGEKIAAAASLDFAAPLPIPPREAGPGGELDRSPATARRPGASAPKPSPFGGGISKPTLPLREGRRSRRRKAAPRYRARRRAGKSAARAQARTPPIPRQANADAHRRRKLARTRARHAARRKRSARPSDRLRESLFNILAHAYGDPVTGARVLDLFAGTGALGLEAVSRGAGFALFVDDGAEARALIRENVATLGLGGVTKIFRRDATKLGAAHPLEPFSLVFLDPPYGYAGLPSVRSRPRATAAGSRRRR